MAHAQDCCHGLKGLMDSAPRARARRRVLALVFPDSRDGRQLRLEPVAESLLSFGARVSLCAERPTVWLDISGCAHLHASAEDASGERTLAARICEHLGGASGDAGLDFRVVVADGPMMAEGVGRYSREGWLTPVRVIPPGAEASMQALAPLSTRALFLDEELRAWLAGVGCARVAELAQIPRAALGPRLGKHAARVLALMQGEDTSPLSAYEPPAFPEVSMVFDDAVASLEPLVFAAKQLSDKLADALDARAMAASGLRCRVHFDAALADGARSLILDFALVTPLHRAGDVLGIVRAKLQYQTLPGPVLRMSLRAQPLVLRPTRAMHLFVSESKADLVLPQLVAELEAELGAERVGVLSVRDAWLPEQRSCLVRVGGQAERAELLSDAIRMQDAPVGACLSGALVPTRQLLEARALREDEVHALRSIPGRPVERLEAVHWWQSPVHTRDFSSAWCTNRQAEAWVERCPHTGLMWLRGWFD